MSDSPAPRTIVKQQPYAVLYSDGLIAVKEVRLSYPHLSPEQLYRNKEGKQSKFGCVGLMPKTAAYASSKDLIKSEIQKILQRQQFSNLPPDAWFLRDGDLKTDKKAWLHHFTVHANENRQPGLRGRGVDPRTGRARIVEPSQAKEVFYPGCVVNMLIKPWWQANEWGKKVNANLVAVQFVRDDARIAEAGAITDEDIDESFEVIPEDDSGYTDDVSDL